MSKGYLVILSLLLPCIVFGQGLGSKSLLHVQSASTLKPRHTELRTNLKFFTKVGDFLGQSKPTNFTAVNWWDVQSNALLTYGISDHFDISAMIQIYQDVHKRDNEANTPGDLFVDLKTGSFGLANNKFNIGGQVSFRIPTGESHNYPFEAYTAGSTEFGAFLLFSYFNDPFLHYRDFSFHGNLGWYWHNDAGETLFAQKTRSGDSTIFELRAGNNASALRFGFGFTYPTELFDLNLELWGNVFTNQPDTAAFSREDYTYFTPSIRFKPQRWISFDLGVDLRLSSDLEETSDRVSFQARNLDLPNYPSWRMTLGTNIVLNGGSKRISSGLGQQEDIRDKVDFYDRLLREREKVRSIEEELRRLRREREQAEKELEELRQLLEEEGNE